MTAKELILEHEQTGDILRGREIHEETMSIEHGGVNYVISYFERPGTKDTLVYLHGLHCSKGDFTGAIDSHALIDHTLIGFNLPPDLTIEDYVEIAKKFIDGLHFDEKLVLVGHSMGGLIAVLLAEKYPALVKAIVNIEGNLDENDCFFSKTIAEAPKERIAQVLEELRDRLEKAASLGLKLFAKRLGKNPQIQRIAASLVRHSQGTVPLEKFTNGLSGFPRLFLYGDANELQLARYILTLQQSGCEVVGVPDSDHFPHIDNPKITYCKIGKFLQKLECPTTPASAPYLQPV